MKRVFFTFLLIFIALTLRNNAQNTKELKLYSNIVKWKLDKFDNFAAYLIVKYKVKHTVSRYSNLLRYEYLRLSKDNKLFKLHIAKKIYESGLNSEAKNKNSSAIGENQVLKICAENYNFTYKQARDSMEINSTIAILFFNDLLLLCKNDTNKALISYNMGFTGAKKVNYKSQYHNIILKKEKEIESFINNNF